MQIYKLFGSLQYKVVENFTKVVIFFIADTRTYIERPPSTRLMVLYVVCENSSSKLGEVSEERRGIKLAKC